MKRVVDIQGEAIFVANEAHMVEPLPLWAFKFTPCIGDYVDIYRGSGVLIVHRAETFDVPYNRYNDTPVVYERKEYKTKKVNRTLYIILAFLFGTFGLQKLYSGKTGQWLLCMVFSVTGIPTLIVYVDIFRAICKTADSNGLIEI